jgi:hypothetical protein
MEAQGKKRFLCADVIPDPIFHPGEIALLWFIVEDQLAVCHLSM